MPLTHAMLLIVTLCALQVLLRARAIETQVSQPTIRSVFLNFHPINTIDASVLCGCGSPGRRSQCQAIVVWTRHVRGPLGQSARRRRLSSAHPAQTQSLRHCGLRQRNCNFCCYNLFNVLITTSLCALYLLTGFQEANTLQSSMPTLTSLPFNACVT